MRGEGLVPRARGDPGLEPGEGKGASQDETLPETPPRPVAASLRLDLSPQAGRGEGGLVLLGEFGRPHGLKGEVRLKSFTADPAAIASYGPLATDGGRTLTLASVRTAPGGAPDLLIARVEGITTREAAEALNRVRLHVAREKLGEPEEDEFFAADLISLAADT